jgi:1-carboxybiuret hydrolase subunit AtzG-like
MPLNRRKLRAKRKRRGAQTGVQKRPRASAKSDKRVAGALEKRRRCSARLRSDGLRVFVKASAQLLDLPIEAEWEGSVTANLDTILRLASAFADFPLPDEAEPAPIFTA